MAARGFATWAETAGTVELEDLFVDPGDRRRGIAAAPVSLIADVLRARATERLEVTANPRHPHARGFYRAAGFVDCGVEEGVEETEVGGAPRMALAISLLRRHHQVSVPLLVPLGSDQGSQLPRAPHRPWPSPVERATGLDPEPGIMLSRTR